ncbi:hypothetical protein SEPCBS57363_003927 [Sporothrix epigloea]|uniref:SMP-30/Gluconolactonase/LRE-like region domain-containing protein n=1 Tax=Sporothrix epigloea TaxID=1892477 RepID=A0ABP0DP97_9PEZI
MTSLLNSNIQINKTPTRVAGGPSVGWREASLPGEEQSGQGFEGVSFVQYSSDFAKIVSEEARHALLLSSADSSRNAFFHRGCVHVIEPMAAGGGHGNDDTRNEGEVLYTVSNPLQAASSSQLPVVLISRIRLQRNGVGDIVAAEWAKLRPPSTMTMPAGAIPYSMPTRNGSKSTLGILYCAQGNGSPGTSGLFYMPRGKPPIPLITSYYGRDFHSVYDVACHPRDGSLWFTDMCVGFEQESRKQPRTPCLVYRFHPGTGDLRVVADGLNRPSGICFSVDADTFYVTDTDSIESHGSSRGGGGAGSIFGGLGAGNDQDQDMQRATTIYAYDVLRRAGSDFLSKKRVFAYSLTGALMGIQCDAAGNVYAGCADGVEVWDAGGVLLGVIKVPGSVTSFCFARNGEMFLCSNHQLWWVDLKTEQERRRLEAC